MSSVFYSFFMNKKNFDYWEKFFSILCKNETN